MVFGTILYMLNSTCRSLQAEGDIQLENAHNIELDP